MNSSRSYLAFDLGASSGRAVLGTLSGDRIEIDEVHRFQTPLVETDRGLFWDADVLWEEVKRGLGSALDAAPDLRSVSVDSWAVDYVSVGPDGQVLRDPYCYRDPRTRGRAAQAYARVPPEELYGRTGIQMLEINTLYQLLADLDDEPEMLERTRFRLPIADYLNYRLCGRAVVERSMASTTQLMDARTGEWAMDLMLRLGIPTEGWPEIVPPGTLLGPVKALYDRARSSTPRPLVGSSSVDPAKSVRVSLPPVAPMVVAGCSHDTAAAVAAVPVDDAASEGSWAFLSSGTWSLLGVERSAPLLTEAARTANFTNEAGLDGTFRFLKNLTGLWVLQECERAWRLEGGAGGAAALISEAEAASSTGETLDLDEPRFAERCDMPERIAVACRDRGMSAPATRGETVRLILESLAAGYARALGELEKVSRQRVEVLHVVGGGSRNTLLCQLTANACKRPVAAGPAEATALGNLLVQARTLGDLPPGVSIRDVVRASARLRPFDPAPDTAGPAPVDRMSESHR